MKYQLHSALSVLLMAGVLPAFAQTGTGSGTGTTPAATCSAVPTGVTALNLERKLNTNNGIFSSLTPTLPDAVNKAIEGGALELREQFSYNPKTQVVSVQGFTSDPAAALPTPSTGSNSSSVLWMYRIQVNSIQFSCQPVPSVLMTGKIVDNFPLTPFGNAIGAPVAIGFGYSAATPAVPNNLTVLIPGLAGLYSATGAGTLTFQVPSVNPPGTTGNKPTIVFTPGATQEVYQKQIYLDASKSTDPNGLQLMFHWDQVNKNIPAGISNADTAMPLITFNGGKGDYVFELTVTNSQGVSDTAQTTIHYSGQ